jgi:hypothetical protein
MPKAKKIVFHNYKVRIVRHTGRLGLSLAAIGGVLVKAQKNGAAMLVTILFMRQPALMARSPFPPSGSLAACLRPRPLVLRSAGCQRRALVSRDRRATIAGQNPCAAAPAPASADPTTLLPVICDLKRTTRRAKRLLRHGPHQRQQGRQAIRPPATSDGAQLRRDASAAHSPDDLLIGDFYSPASSKARRTAMDNSRLTSGSAFLSSVLKCGVIKCALRASRLAQVS